MKRDDAGPTESEDVGPTEGEDVEYLGVTWELANRKWRASIRAEYGQRTIGRFDSKSDAARAYDVKAAPAD